MTVATLRLDLRLAFCTTPRQSRLLLEAIMDKLRGHFNVSVVFSRDDALGADRAVLLVATAARTRKDARATLERVADALTAHPRVEVLARAVTEVWTPMPSHRSLRIAEAIREVVSSAILFDVSDPRVQGVTVLRVEVSGDLRNATAYVSIMGTENEQRSALSGLRSATGFLQARVAQRLQTRTTPVLLFKLDDSVKKSVQMSRLIDDALAHADDPLQVEDATAANECEEEDEEIDEAPEGDESPEERRG